MHSIATFITHFIASFYYVIPFQHSISAFYFVVLFQYIIPYFVYIIPYFVHIPFSKVHFPSKIYLLFLSYYNPHRGVQNDPRLLYPWPAGPEAL